ncbi:Hemolysin [Minicystis rosea]|nr:Hemolysin [Minicystis rosea]
MSTPLRPPFIVSTADVPEEHGRYPGSDEVLSAGRAIGKAAGLLRIGLHVERVGPGQRTSWPHAEEDEEEFVYVLEGEIDAWIDGELHPMKKGDLAAFPSGTGISHTFLNNGDQDALLLVGGEAGKSDSKIFYPLHPERRKQMPWSRWWDDIPARPLGSHDGIARRKSE